MQLCQIWTCCSWYKCKSKKKKLVAKNKKIYFAECQTEGTRQRGRRWVPLSPGASLPSAQLSSVWHWAKFGFAECLILPSARHSAKPYLPSAKFRRVRHSAKVAFAECPIFGTRQRFEHWAKSRFPIVHPSVRSHCFLRVCLYQLNASMHCCFN
jgi:hypothetical protein